MIPGVFPMYTCGILAPGQRGRRRLGSHAAMELLHAGLMEARSAWHVLLKSAGPRAPDDGDGGCVRSGSRSQIQVWGALGGGDMGTVASGAKSMRLGLSSTDGSLGFGAQPLAEATAGQAQLSLQGGELYKQEVQGPDPDVL